MIMSLVSINYSAVAQFNTSAQEVATPELAKQREEQKKVIVAGYLKIKNSLVISDSQKTATSASEFSEAIGKFKLKKLTADEMNAAALARRIIKQMADSIVIAPSISQQRELMDGLSLQFWSIIEKVKPENFTLYLNKCPKMRGAWISDDKKIENPYSPKDMLTCGEVIDKK